MAPTNNSTTWVAPRTWSAGELVTASIMNAHVRDNLNALKTPAGGYNTLNIGADITTTSTSFVDIDATNLILTFTTGGGDVLIGFVGTFSTSANANVYLDIHESVAGARYFGDDGLVAAFQTNTANSNYHVSFVVRLTGLSAASHAFKLQWKVSAGTTTLYAGAGTANRDLHPHMWAKEF